MGKHKGLSLAPYFKHHAVVLAACAGSLQIDQNQEI